MNTINKNSSEYQLYSKPTEQELIILSMLSVSNEKYMKTRAISENTKRVISCISSALGIPSGVWGLKTRALIFAKTGLQILKAVAKRYAFGYIAFAFSVC